MAQFTLDDIRAAADALFGSTDIPVTGGVVHLQNPLRLSKDERKELVKLQSSLGSSDDEDGEDKPAEVDAPEKDQADLDAQIDEQVSTLEAILRVVAQEKQLVEVLIEALDHDLAQLMALFKHYSEGTQAGEASASES